MEARIRAIGMVAPGMQDWAAAKSILAGDTPGGYRPGAVSDRPRSAILPRTESRRATNLIHLALCAAEQALPDDGTASHRLMSSVFASADGDIETEDRLCTSVADAAPWVSPHSFHNSVHNAPSGYWSIALGCQGPSTSLSAGNDSFVAGLLEALMILNAEESDTCLLVAYEQASPPLFSRARPVTIELGIAILLATDGAGPRLRLRSLTDSTEPDRLEDPDLERLRRENPIGRALPLLAAIARCESATVHLPYKDVAASLEIES